VSVGDVMEALTQLELNQSPSVERFDFGRGEIELLNQ
jgi:hypothetical protein